jgi:hypothetical protein
MSYPNSIVALIDPELLPLIGSLNDCSLWAFFAIKDPGHKLAKSFFIELLISIFEVFCIYKT